jgi:hypothetical protein
MNMLHKLAGLALALALALPTGAGAQKTDTLHGEVLEVLNVDSYTYLRLKTGNGEAWAAVTTAAVAKGARVSIANAVPMDQFESKALKRRFERVYFGQIAGAGPKVAADGTPPARQGGLQHGMPGAMHKPGSAGTAAVATAPVPRASGADARTVAEVVQGRARLKDTTVAIRARVVKVNNGIMGKNWLHLQDGSGQASDGSHDIVVTSKDTAAVGDIVTARGTVRTDVTVGPGYAWAVLVENASVGK